MNLHINRLKWQLLAVYADTCCLCKVLVWLFLLPEEVFKHFIYARKVHSICAKQKTRQSHTRSVEYVSETVFFMNKTCKDTIYVL